MARKPSEPSPKSTSSKTGGDDRSAEQRAPAGARTQIVSEGYLDEEHTGPTEAASPVVVTRLRKGDGRALILYSADRDAGGRA